MSQLPLTTNKEGVCIALILVLLLFACLTPAFSQKVGVNTESPEAGLHIVSNDGLLVQGEIGQGTSPVSGPGLRMIFNTKSGSFRAGRITDAENSFFETWWNLENVGDYSFASGLNLKASGFVSAAFGNQNQATGLGAFVAGGLNNTASGNYAITGGIGNSAPSYSEMVFGTFATDYIPGGINGIISTDRLFVIGNGANEGSRSNALTILKNGNTGIGTNSPSQRLHVNGIVRVENGRLDMDNGGYGTFVGEGAGGNDHVAGLNANTFVGRESGAFTTTGAENTAIGAFSGKQNAVGGQNVSVGHSSMENKTSGGQNTAIGYGSQKNNTNGTSNTSLGYLALENCSGQGNIGIGSNAGANLVLGTNNIFLGNDAGSESSGSDNIMIGTEAGRYAEGSNQLFIENSSSSTPLIYGDFATNTVIIRDSLQSTFLKISNGASNGYLLKSDANGNASWTSPSTIFSDDWSTSGSNIHNANVANVGIGTSSPSDKLHVLGNLRVDAGRISVVNTGQSVFVGSQAGQNDNLSDNKNVMIGYNAGAGNSDGSNNIAIGSEAMANGSNYHYNIAIGSNVMSSSILSGGYNTAIGNFALQLITSGTNNLAMGQNALGAATGATQNIAIGNYAGDAILTGTSNVAIGVEALGSATTGFNNTVIGYEAGRNTTGNSNIFLGYNAGRNETGSNKLYIENSNSSNPLIHGDFSTNKVTINDSLQTKYLKMTVGSGAGKTLKSDANGNGTWIAPNLLFEDTLNANIFLGSGVGGSVTSATNNTIMGAYAGEELTSGYENTGYGQWALQNCTDTYGNTAIGHNTLRTNVNGDNNTALGWSALSGIEGFDNTALGASAGGNNTTGSDNVFIGKESGSNNDGSGNIFIGNESGKNTTGSNQLMIDNSSTSTPLIKGDFAANEVTINDSLTVNKELSVGISVANSTLEINGSVAAKFKTPLVAGTTNPDGTGMVWRYNSGTGTITLPGAATCPNRIYVIINQTGSTRTISTYRDLVTNNQSTITSSVALWLMSDGAEWWQIK